jgi:ankyrin repeat protein
MKRISQTTFLAVAALLTAATQAVDDSDANARFWKAVSENDLTAVQKELPPTGKADVNSRFRLGMTALMVSAATVDLALVKYLIE